MSDVVRGAVAGFAGTVAMTVAFAATRATGFLRGETPPRKVSRRAEEAVGVRDELPRLAFEASWIAQHFAYGTAAGVAYALAQRRLKLGEPLPAGPAFGVALWAFGYSGWLPATGLYPPPTREPKDRVGMLIMHHLVYGTTTAAVSRALRSPGDRAS